MADVIARERECEVVTAFLADQSPEQRILVLEGDAGIGKTTLWRFGLEAAKRSDRRILSCAPDGSEAGISLAALADLLRPITDVSFSDLPAPQRAALETALLLRDGPSPSQLEVGLSVATLLNAEAAHGLVLAIDDLQWLDGASAAILSFALRRVRGSLRLLVSQRIGSSDPLGIDRFDSTSRAERLLIGPLGVDEIARLVRERLQVNLSRPILVRLVDASGGNPLFALEIARNFDPSSRELSVPPSLREAVKARLERVSDSALEVGLVAAALSRPTVVTIGRAIGDRVRADAGLMEAEEAEVITTVGGRVVFTHPLVGSTIYGSTSPTKRRLLHRKLAIIVDDAEERARHRALGADGPDEEIAAVLEEAAATAFDRGAPAGAAQLLERSAALTPAHQDGERRRRSLQAALRHFDSGDAHRALHMLEEAAEVFPTGLERAKALTLLAAVRGATDGNDAALQTSLQALEEAEGHPAQQVAIREQLAWSTLGNAVVAHEHAKAALDLMAGVDDEVQLMGVLAILAETEFRLGLEAANATIERALVLERSHPNAVSVIDSPTAAWTLQLWRMERIDDADEFVERCELMAEALGDEASKDWVFLTRGTNALARGDAAQALTWLSAAREVLLQSGMEANDVCVRTFTALGQCYQGLSTEARVTASESRELAETTGNQRFAGHSRWIIGLCHSFEGDYVSARAELERAHSIMLNSRIVEPNFFHTLIPDYAEVLVALGDLNDAAAVLEPYVAAGRRLDRKGVLGNAARARGLIAAAQGRVEEADGFLTDAVGTLEQGPSAHDLGRALTSLGAHYRRTKRKKLARESLERSIGVFESVGAAGWADKARAELARIGGRSPGGLELTETEQQVAKLVAEGLTNKEVAEQLYISVRTVETNLSKIYVKLNVRSRTELVRALADR